MPIQYCSLSFGEDVVSDLAFFLFEGENRYVNKYRPKIGDDN